MGGSSVSAAAPEFDRTRRAIGLVLGPVAFVVVLLLFGAKNLPQIARTLGKTMEQFQRAARDVRMEIARAGEEDETQKPFSSEPLPGQVSRMTPDDEDSTENSDREREDGSPHDVSTEGGLTEDAAWVEPPQEDQPPKEEPPKKEKEQAFPEDGKES